MLWFAPRSYLKWVGAVTVVAFSWWIQLMPTPTSLHPFAVADIAVGTEISDHLFEFREIPTGLLPPVAIGGTISVKMAAGDPLLPSILSEDRTMVPEGWWAVELAAPPGLVPGSHVMLVMGEDQLSTEPSVAGIVIRPQVEGTYGEETALIAVPEEQLSRVSVASAYGTLTVAVAPNRQP